MIIHSLIFFVISEVIFNEPWAHLGNDAFNKFADAVSVIATVPCGKKEITPIQLLSPRTTFISIVERSTQFRNICKCSKILSEISD